MSGELFLSFTFFVFALFIYHWIIISRIQELKKIIDVWAKYEMDLFERVAKLEMDNKEDDPS